MASSLDVPRSISPLPSTALEYSESRSIVLSWLVKDLKTHFEGSKQDTKSRCVKSVPFDNGRWQLFFYTNSGVDNHIGWYLAAIPTVDEKERGQNGEWERDGVYRFTFDLKSVDGNTVYKSMEAQNHKFSSSNFNWGWNSFMKRHEAWFGNAKVRQQDAFLVICTVVSTPQPPELSPRIEQKMIPLALVEAYAALFDDPMYSDVVFRIQHNGGSVRRVYASRKILSMRSDYFATLFSGEWAEARSDDGSVNDSVAIIHNADVSHHLDEESDEDALEDDSHQSEEMEADEDFENEISSAPSYEEVMGTPQQSAASQLHSTPPRVPSADPTSFRSPTSSASRSDIEAPREAGSSSSSGTNLTETYSTPKSPYNPNKRRATGRRRARVNVTDASYEAYRALLCWCYTDTVPFRPLNSVYYAGKLTSSDARFRSLADFHAISATAQNLPTILGVRPVKPCSAKSIYTLADKLSLPELKARAFDHIQRSLTIQNCAFEVFSAFSNRFSEVQQHQIEFMLANWQAVRGSPAMSRVLAMLGSGKWPAFADVWLRLMPNLEVRPTAIGDSPSPSGNTPRSSM